jgi:hypothetical protein
VVVDGRNVWSSGAHDSELGILLARTDPDAPKHKGITYLVLDMTSPGIEVRPLRQINGVAHFNEVFLTEVRIPHENVVGDVNGGWGVAQTTLGAERVLIGSGGAVAFRDLARLASEQQRTGDPVLRQRLADAYIRFQIVKYLGQRAQAARRNGAAVGAEASVLKLAVSENVALNGDLALALEGATAMLLHGDAPYGGFWQQQFLNQWGTRIGGCTEQVQRNVIGERVLGLPPEPRPDKRVPSASSPGADRGGGRSAEEPRTCRRGGPRTITPRSSSRTTISYRFIAEGAASGDWAASIEGVEIVEPGSGPLEHEYLYWIGGAALAGAAVVGINPTRRGAELAHDVRHTDCQLVVSDEAGAATLAGLDLGIPPDAMLTVGTRAYDARLREYDGAPLPSPLPAPDARLLLLFTSARRAPKAVVCSSGSSGGSRADDDQDVRGRPRQRPVMSRCRCSTAMRSWPMSRRRSPPARRSLRRRFSASGSSRRVRRYGATYFNYVGRALSYVPRGAGDARRPRQPSAARLRDRGVGARPLLRFEQLRLQAHRELRLQRGRHRHRAATGMSRAGASGKPQPGEGADVVVMDPDTGKECAAAVFGRERSVRERWSEAIGELVPATPAPGSRATTTTTRPPNECVTAGTGAAISRTGMPTGGSATAGRSGRPAARRQRELRRRRSRDPVRLPGVVMVAVYPVPDAHRRPGHGRLGARTGWSSMRARSPSSSPTSRTSVRSGRRDMCASSSTCP